MTRDEACKKLAMDMRIAALICVTLDIRQAEIDRKPFNARAWRIKQQELIATFASGPRV